ncbi:MAG: RsbRD N-terminal domain-containing protein, partial [Pseudomonadota bacterium]|nr:RsbRD N-terminal domain-containing protein [Pseudomonadota bacterium]
MKLSRFIVEQMQTILAEWDLFARTQFPEAAGISAADLRDHAEEILNATARDIDTSESSEERAEESKGLEPRQSDGSSAASTHGSQRQHLGFSMDQLIAEYRALRASVLRLWLRNMTEVS